METNDNKSKTGNAGILAGDMEISKKRADAEGTKFFIERKGKEIARAYLYLMKNDLHEKPFGLLEDVFVQEECRNFGYGVKLIKEVIKTAKQKNCYKLIATSRFERENVHSLYGRMGFKPHGLEFRMDF